MGEDLLEICNELVKLGLDLGAQEAEVITGRQKSIEAGAENNEMKLAKTSIASGVGIRVFKNGSLGFSSVNTLQKNALERAVRNAISLSKNAPMDEFNALPQVREIRKIGGLYDKNIAEMSEDSVIRKAKNILSAGLDVDDRIFIESARYHVMTGEKAIANSNGVEGSEEFTAAYFDIGTHAIEGTNVSPADYRMDGYRSLGADRSEEISRELAESVIDSLYPMQMESCKGSLIIAPIAAIEILISPIFFSVDSNNVQKGVSRFIGRRGEAVASKLLNVIDDGTAEGAFSSSSFDREGVPHQRLPVISNGKLEAFLYNQYTANKEKIESTGHASGTPMSIPKVDSTNLWVSNGTESLDEMTSEIKQGLFVQRFSGRVDPVSGDFSGVAKMSKKIEDGIRSNIVRETMISGNVFDVLLRLSHLSRETESILDTVLPYFMVDDMTITGA
ncbi:MAG: TldD/PmbA family protein [Thermoplasmata archaeon]|nr:TldD/PmbA family protein [Thermoplasmata archaeon]